MLKKKIEEHSSIFTPKSTSNKYVEVFKNMAQDDIRNLKMSKNKRNKDEMLAIKELEKKKGIVIRPADRGGW